MNPALASLRRARGRLDAAVERFLANHTLPLVDPGGVTFVWRGSADVVRLRTWAYGLDGALALERVGLTDLWAVHVEMPAGSRLEYKFEIIREHNSEWVTDPLNPLLAHDPFGANSVCRAFGYARPDWSEPDPNVPAGHIEQLEVPAAADTAAASIRVWLPARFTPARRYPLLVLHDGGDFLRYGDLAATLDNLVHRLEVPDVIVALHEPSDRNREYSASDAHARWLAHALLPAIAEAWPLDGRHALLGASLGAVASLHAAWSYPEQWQHLGLLSGSFAFSDIGSHGRDSLFDPIVRFVNRFREAPRPLDARWYMACGRYERLIHENRAMASMLGAHAVDLRFDEVPDGHHWECWRDCLRNALGWLLPGPVWMVYE